MKLTCPACGAQTSLEAMTEDAAARRVAALFGELSPSVARQVPAYLALWRPAKTGLRWTRSETILAELVGMVRDGFKRQGRRCKAGADVWQSALQEVCSRDLRRPLKSHGYLMEVVVGLAEQYSAAAEERYHQDVQAGHRPAREPQSSPAPDPVQQAIDGVLHRFSIGGMTAEQRDQEIEEIRRVS